MADKKNLGVLILHGFTGNVDTVKGLLPTVERLELPWRMPTLRGHGTRVEDLVGVTPADWYADAEAALADLLNEVERVVVVGLSMGGLVTLNLAIAHEKDLAGIVLVAPALRFADPLVGLTPLLKLFVPFWPSPNSFADPARKRGCTNYPTFPTATFSALLDYANETERRLPQVRVPVRVLHSKRDTVIHPISSTLVTERVASAEKGVIWFERSGHEMMLDCEDQAVFQAIGAFLAEKASRMSQAS